tara:strand:+ start:776 stop:1516 length:741 start_codon:yes stop_codon:yes gene_type:complete
MRLQQNNKSLEKELEVKNCLQTVFDPELDESIIDLNFISSIDIEANELVRIKLRLPTYFCSANFAWIMCCDTKKAVERLRWVNSVHIKLVDHFVMKKINDGLKNNRSFSDVFGTKKEMDFLQLRRKFEEKAFLNRQSMLIQFLRTKDLSDTQILKMSLKNLEILVKKYQNSEFYKNFIRYHDLKKRIVPKKKDNSAFTGLDGKDIKEQNVLEYLRVLRRTTGSITANSEMCKVLMAERYAAGGQIN